MIPWVACRRATLLVPSGPDHDPDRLHLHIILNDPWDAGDGAKVLVVSVCSIPETNIYDPSCSLFPDEHPFIKKHSYVAYRFCRLLEPAHLEAKVQAGEFIAKQVLDEKPFGFVLEGLIDSPHTALRYKKFLQALNEAVG